MNKPDFSACTVAAVPPFNIVTDEVVWRARSIGFGAPSEPRIVATRWRSLGMEKLEVKADTPVDGHLVSLVLRNENVCLSVSGRTIHDGPAAPGLVHLTEPAVSSSCIFRGPYDVLHLHVPNRLIAEFGRDAADCGAPALRSTVGPIQDPTAERLGRALLGAEELGGASGQLYADCIGTAIVARLLAATHGTDGARPKVAELARWRLRRVLEYIEANLGEPVSLADLASVAGLTRMHFAAQFRVATGLPPHQYVLRRRIERAQEMLVGANTSLVETALSVGFQSQSHFTSVFKRLVGKPPYAWRRSQSVNCGSAKSWDAERAA